MSDELLRRAVGKAGFVGGGVDTVGAGAGVEALDVEDFGVEGVGVEVLDVDAALLVDGTGDIEERDDQKHAIRDSLNVPRRWKLPESE